MKNPYNPTTKQMREEIAEMILHREDLTHSDIAERYGISKDVVSKIAQQHGIQRKKSKGRHVGIPPEEMSSIIADLRGIDLTAKEIAKKYGRAKTTILDIAKKSCPDMDMRERGHNIRINRKLAGGATKSQIKEINRYRRDREEKERRMACPREQKIATSRQSIEHRDPQIRPAFSWDTISMILQARYEAGEEGLRGSFDRKALAAAQSAALDKLRTVLEQYEFPEDTPNRRHDHLHETV